ncbi:MAG: GGDEF domain-containing protein [Trueperaceae bacterium]
MVRVDKSQAQALSRFRTYQIVLGAALITYGIDFGFGLVLGESRVMLSLWLVMLGIITFILWHMLKHGRLFRKGELIGYSLITANGFFEFVLGLATEEDLTTTLLNVGIWLLVFYVFAFFVFESKWGLRVSAVVSLASLTIGVPIVVVRDLATTGEFYALLKFYCANFFVIMFGYAAAVWRENYEQIRSDAEVAEQLALTDSLTNIYNRRGLELLLEKEIVRAERYGRDLSMILFDLDDFKRINDNYGHALGDDVLKKVADVAQAQLRKGDEVGRWGGEEFMIICPETNAEQACMVAERLRKAIANASCNRINFTASFGIASRQRGEMFASLYKHTDAALYAAKSAGKNCVKLALVNDVLQ